MNSTVKHLLIWVLTLGCLLVGWRFVATNMAAGHDKAVSLTQFQDDADAGKISDVTVDGADVTGKYKDGKETFHTTIPANYLDHDEEADLNAHGVDVTFKSQQGKHVLECAAELCADRWCWWRCSCS